MTNGTNLPARPEITNILNESQANTTFEKIFKYDRGRYLCDGQEIKLGTKVVAHCIGWAKEWIKFQGGQFIERKIYRIARGERPPDRSTLDARDEKFWDKGFNGNPKDPWVFRYLLPMQRLDTDQPMIFVTQSFGGQRAVDDLCNAWANRASRNPNCGQPVILLESATFPSKQYGQVQRPDFRIVGWDDGSSAIRELPNISGPGGQDAALRKADFDDEIPF